ncbi:MAG: ABC-F family ATP-binding cassette domain-containing protein [Eubacteriaceae bacterium]|nr:ABC-F family ATP-binding cassette domain-containing protein [Eubacteriaceae bacterium]
MSLISVKGLSFSYRKGEPVFSDVSFDLDTNWRTALIGMNGCGKTTLLRILAGEEEYGGKIIMDTSPEYFPFPVEDTSLTGREIILSKAPEAQDWEIAMEANLMRMGEDVTDRSFSTLSGGEQVKVLLIALFITGEGFLLIDEPTNHLDMASRDDIASYLKRKKGFILVSHDRDFIDAVADHIISIEPSGIYVCRGNYSSWKEDLDRRISFETTKNERLEKEIASLNAAAARTAEWAGKLEKGRYHMDASEGSFDRGYAGHLSARMMKRSKAIEKRIERSVSEKEGLLRDVWRTDELKIVPLQGRRTELITVRDLSVTYGGKRVFEPVSFVLKKGERLALTGGNGAGKSSLIRLLMGEEIEYEGFFSVASGLEFSFVPQFTDSVSGTLNDYALARKLEPSIFRAMLSKMGVKAGDGEAELSELSEGQKRKVLLAASVSESADIYFWDEPLNYVDIPTRIQLEEAIMKYSPTMVFCEHESAFVRNIATVRVELK